MQRLYAEDFMRSFGTEVLPGACLDMIARRDFSYSDVHDGELAALIAEVDSAIERDTKIVGTPERKAVWETGWQQHRNDFLANGDVARLKPRFLKERAPMRWNGRYIRSPNPDFEHDFLDVLRTWLIATYLEPFDPVYEFGCGTCETLLAISTAFPQKRLRGFDFTESAAALANDLGSRLRRQIEGRVFDLMHPDYSVALERSSAVLTLVTIEQLASKVDSFLAYLLHWKPGICVHVEPIPELYAESDEFDARALRFHRKRRYSEGFLPALQEHEKQKKLELLHVKRCHFGSLFHEGYSLVVWRPL
jgi:hypothetical protein